MKIIIVVASIIVPLLMIYFQHHKTLVSRIYHIIALIAFLIFGNIAALSIYQIIKEQTVFTMEIHGLFLNPFFLITGAYIGVYVIYHLLLLSLNTKH